MLAWLECAMCDPLQNVCFCVVSEIQDDCHCKTLSTIGILIIKKNLFLETTKLFESNQCMNNHVSATDELLVHYTIKLYSVKGTGYFTINYHYEYLSHHMTI